LLREIEERRRSNHACASQQAEQANLSKTKFLAAVSHDLLQPLNARGCSPVPCWTPRGGQQRGAQRQQFLEDVENLLGTLVIFPNSMPG
jgi:K+-sensing histidine kinase KdpD